VLLKNNGGTYQLRADIYTDGGTWTNGSLLNITDDRQLLEVEWKAASAVDANDGYLKSWINDVLVYTRSGVDNDTRLVTDISLGAGATCMIPAGVSGTLYFDAFESRRGAHIGPVAYSAPNYALVKNLLQFQPQSILPALNFAPLQQGTPATINYVYDSLKRLKEANYTSTNSVQRSNGDYYRYTYDAVRNVLEYTQTQGGHCRDHLRFSPA
jgi:hypothetical protein